MTIIPGAAYLSTSEQKVYIGDSEGDLLTVAPAESVTFDLWLEPHEFPTDLVLLYAPGDEVVPYWENGPETHIRHKVPRDV